MARERQEVCGKPETTVSFFMVKLK